MAWLLHGAGHALVKGPCLTRLNFRLENGKAFGDLRGRSPREVALQRSKFQQEPSIGADSRQEKVI